MPGSEDGHHGGSHEVGHSEHDVDGRQTRHLQVIIYNLILLKGAFHKSSRDIAFGQVKLHIINLFCIRPNGYFHFLNLYV